MEERPASRSFLLGLSAATVVVFAVAIWIAAPRPPYAPANLGPPTRVAAETTAAPGSDLEVTDLEVQELCDRGRALAGQGNLDQALKVLLEARRLAPDSAEVHQYLSNVYYMSGRRQQALAAVERALTLSPDNQLYQRNAAALRQELSRQIERRQP
jgi:tetratricopeptide (TPR) repeat protein